MDKDPLRIEEDPQPIDMLESGPEETARIPSDTVGTGSYVAVSCSVLAILATLVLIAGLLVWRWLG
jgi:hypothetical protein